MSWVQNNYVTTVLIVIALAGCAGGQTRAPIEGRKVESLSRPAQPVAKPVNTQSQNPGTGPKIFALPDHVRAPKVVVTPEIPAPDRALSPSSNLAVAELISKADAATIRGDGAGARAILERALKVQADDAHVWYRLAELNFDEGEFEQAIVAADRCRSLAAADRDLIARANDLTVRARRSLAH